MLIFAPEDLAEVGAHQLPLMSGNQEPSEPLGQIWWAAKRSGDARDFLGRNEPFSVPNLKTLRRFFARRLQISVGYFLAATHSSVYRQRIVKPWRPDTKSEKCLEPPAPLSKLLKASACAQRLKSQDAGGFSAAWQLALTSHHRRSAYPLGLASSRRVDSSRST